MKIVALQNVSRCACGRDFVTDVSLMLLFTKWISIEFCVTHSLTLCYAIKVCFSARVDVDIVAFVTTLSLSNMLFPTFETYTLVLHSILRQLLMLQIPIQM